MSELVPCVLLLAVGPAGVCSCAVLDSSSVSIGSLCIITGSGGPAGCVARSSAGFS